MDYETGKMLEAVHAKLDYLIARLCPPSEETKTAKENKTDED